MCRSFNYTDLLAFGNHFFCCQNSPGFPVFRGGQYPRKIRRVKPIAWEPASGRGWRNIVVRATVFSAFMKGLQLRNTVFGSRLLKRLSRRLQKPDAEIPKHLTRDRWRLSSSKIGLARADTSQLLEGQVKRFQRVSWKEIGEGQPMTLKSRAVRSFVGRESPHPFSFPDEQSWADSDLHDGASTSIPGVTSTTKTCRWGSRGARQLGRIAFGIPLLRNLH